MAPYLVPIVGTLFLGLIAEYIRLKGSQAVIERANSILLKENAKFQITVDEQSAVIAEAGAKLAVRESVERIRAKYTVDETTADLILDGRHYCHLCFHEGLDRPVEMPMIPVTANRWQCPKHNPTSPPVVWHTGSVP